ncbi:hypothetical protein GRI89_07425 [Altererythrobacter salegens]|uniref:Uncharacterized protein n=1 Tax=Croceibacterium salegens TaxID=1737568 RepID=A0A6I4SWB9_9SPHN|nr:hypothetical protein [Croceibacterium salegens]MXO59370.1 hypothetical protein [Croceibacterium salegens]
MRPTSKIYDSLPSSADRLCKAAEETGPEALLDFDSAWRFAAWVNGLVPANPVETGSIDVPEGEHLVFAPGSLVSFRKQGQNFEKRLIAPEMFHFPAGDLLFCLYECDEDASAWVAHHAVEPIGFDWSSVLWNPTTNEMRPCGIVRPIAP